MLEPTDDNDAQKRDFIDSFLDLKLVRRAGAQAVTSYGSCSLRTANTPLTIPAYPSAAEIEHVAGASYWYDTPGMKTGGGTGVVKGGIGMYGLVSPPCDGEGRG